MQIILNDIQSLIVHSPVDAKIFIEGFLGTGKTTIGTSRYSNLINNTIAPESILILLPQHTLAKPYIENSLTNRLISGRLPIISTLGSLAKNVIQLFWPCIAREAGFENPEYPPTFLNIETSQHYLLNIITPLRNKGYFGTITIGQNRLLTQILDSLNKSALVGFSHKDISTRLISSWAGEEKITLAYEESQEVINLFRAFCLKNNLLDYSLQIETFIKQAWGNPSIRSYLNRYRHLIYDNIEEDIPVAHDMITDWFQDLDSALLIFNKDGGYRTFLGADPDHGYSLKVKCNTHYDLSESFTISNDMEQIRQNLTSCIDRSLKLKISLNSSISFSNYRYFTEMVDWVCQELHRLIIEKEIPSNQIAILSPYISDSLQFLLEQSLSKYKIKIYTHRPSRAFKEEPVINCLLTYAKIAHTQWNFTCTQYDLAIALMSSINGFDLIRANLLSKIVYHRNHLGINLSSFKQISSETNMPGRISYPIGEAYENLRQWLVDYMNSEELPLDIFLSQLFGEVLSQPGYTFHGNIDSALLTSQLTNSIRQFRLTTNNYLIHNLEPMGKEYIQLIDQGIIASQYVPRWDEQPEDAVILIPAYTYMMMDQPVKYQFWLDIGGMSWWERLYQPLTHPYVLSRSWEVNSKWTDSNEFESNQKSMTRLVSGLLRHCKDHVYLCISSVNEYGAEERGPLLQAVQRLLRYQAKPSENIFV